MSTVTNYKTNTSPDNKSEKKSVKKYKILAGIGLAVVIIIALIFLNRQYLSLYYANIKYNDFKVGDKLYAKNWLVNETSKYGSYNLHLYRKIRPLDNSSSSNKPAIIQSRFSISSDSLCKYKTACIGNYTGSEILEAKLGQEYYPMIFFSITTNKKALIKEEESYSNQLPFGYVYDDGPFYVVMIEVTHHELHQFRKLSK
ncbi:hypothetical protein [Mucilaginibacter dorajii]|uniref:Uncharacterized protein n=1 Tax=Mucilaginibacter dorajii TaxID=692994 RepID=A0ABP7RA38_9SPHI|nr:hypothetical protein [Mucilaginibacter dorajii]MCS3736750.1 hypothetical protein [Mucilaginibacter dorajii]